MAPCGEGWFSSEFSRLGHGILGQKGFFDTFVVKFDFLKEEIELKARNEKKT